jgi:hypothetical protein
VVACETSHKVVWLQKLLTGFLDIAMEVTCILCDNQSCINLSESLVSHDKSKTYLNRVSLY